MSRTFRGDVVMHCKNCGWYEPVIKGLKPHFCPQCGGEMTKTESSLFVNCDSCNDDRFIDELPQNFWRDPPFKHCRACGKKLRFEIRHLDIPS